MSHSDGLAILPNGYKYNFEYDGTADICCTRLYEDYKEMHNNWRKDNCKECICNIPTKTKVILTTSYAAWNFLWESEICTNCMCITGKIHDWEY